MSAVALIAVKPLGMAKSRLSAVLHRAERRELARTFLAHVLNVASCTPLIDDVFVVTPNPCDVPKGFPTIKDPGRGLNMAADYAARVLRGRGVRELLVLPADLPLIEEADLRALILAGRACGGAVAQDHHGTGTNGLWMPMPPGIDFAFGPGSCQKHVSAWRLAGVEAIVVQRPGLAYDIDEPSDLPRLFRTRARDAVHA